MTWGDVSKCFNPSWADQWKLDATAKLTEDQLSMYEEHIKGSKKTFFSQYTPGTTTAGRKASAKQDPNTTVITKTTARTERKDAGKGRKWQNQEAFVIALVAKRWDDGDPIGKTELKDEVLARDDCVEGTPFWNSYADPSKKSSASGWTNWLDRVLARSGWSLRANSIGQTVPENWRPMSVANAARIQKSYKEANVQVTINADQTFVKFFMEEAQVVAPTGTKRIGGKIKADVKKGFTLMVACNKETSLMEPPFSVFDGTKLCTAKNPERTLAWKYRNWRGSAPGRTGFMSFQKKHWFDEDITIEWLGWVLDVLYPGKKVCSLFIYKYLNLFDNL